MLEFRDVTFSYSDADIIKQLSLNFVNNRVTAIVGPSGCGKSTIFKLISGLIKPSSGGIKTDFYRDAISYVFQDYRLLPWFNVYENIAVGLARSGGSRSDKDGLINSALCLVNMNSCSAMYPFQLSGGMQQRVGLARALVSKPELLLMDEPFSAVDGQTRQLLVEEFKQLKDELSMTTLIATHQFQDVIDLADQVVLLSSSPSTCLKVINVQSYIEHSGERALCDEMWKTLKSHVDSTFKHVTT